VTAGRPDEAPVPFAVPERLQVVDSTNRYLVDLARVGFGDGSEVPEGYAVVADRQSEGRGRLARRWESPAGTSVLCSILFRPDLDAPQLHLTAWAVALAARRASRDVAGVELSLKWPNDLLAGPGSGRGEAAAAAGRAGRKVAGVLSELVPPAGAHVRARGTSRLPGGVVVGVGINVNWPPDWPPSGSKDPELVSIAAHATALNRLAGRDVDRNVLVAALLRSSGELNAMLASDQGRLELASRYRSSCSTIGREVRVELSDGSVTGTALDVDDAGCLLVSTDACIRTIAAGDVVHVR